MELTVLGTSATFPTPKRACSCYLVVEGEKRLLLDLGAGAFPNLTVFERPENLDAILISHLHADHFIDLYPLYYYLKYEARVERRLPIHAPVGALERLGRLLGDEGPDELSAVFDFVEIEEGRRKIAGFDVTFFQVKHPGPAYGVVIEAGGRSLAYSADTGYSEDLVRCIEGAAVFICEATLIEPVPGLEHMTAEEAGRLASAASVERLVLTHVWPSIDHESIRLVAKEHFVGEVLLAEDGDKMVV